MERKKNGQNAGQKDYRTKGSLKISYGGNSEQPQIVVNPQDLIHTKKNGFKSQLKVFVHVDIFFKYVGNSLSTSLTP